MGTINLALTAGVGQFITGMNSAQGAITAFSVRATGLKAVILGTGLALEQMAVSSVQAAAGWEDMQVTFEALTGSAATAASLLDRLQKLAMGTPFEMKDLTKGTQRLLQYGFSAQEAADLVERLGNLAAAAPDGMAEGLDRLTLALGQVRAAGRLTGEEARQLRNVGVPVVEALSQQFGKSSAEISDMMRAGQISATDAIRAFVALADSPKFADLMKKRSQTFNGLMSILRDNVALSMRDIGRIVTEAFDLKGTAIAVTAFVSDVRSRLDGLRAPLQLVGAGFQSIRDIALTAGRGVVDVLREWGVSVDASAPRLANVKEMVTGAFQTAALWINRAANQMVRFGGYVLEYAVAPLMELVEAFADLGAVIASSRFFKDEELEDRLKEFSFQTGFARMGIQRHALDLMRQPLDAGADAIKNFFKRVNLAPIRSLVEQFGELKEAALGVAAAFGRGVSEGGMLGVTNGSVLGMARGIVALPALLRAVGLAGGKGELNLNIPDAVKGAKGNELKLSPVAVQGSAEAVSTANKDFMARTAGMHQDKVVAAVEKGNQKLDKANDKLGQIVDRMNRQGLDPL